MLDEGELGGGRATLHAIHDDHIRSRVHRELHVIKHPARPIAKPQTILSVPKPHS